MINISKETSWRVANLNNMNETMKLLNNEANKIKETWKTLGIPGECKDEIESNIFEIASRDEDYKDVCILYSELISGMILNGAWSEDGFTEEFYLGKNNLKKKIN